MWGDNNGGVAHIIEKHVGEKKSFATAEEAAEVIENVIKNGNVYFENGDKVVFKLGTKLVTVRKNFREKGKKIADKNWVLTAYDEMAADNSISAIAAPIQAKAAPGTAKSAGKGSEFGGEKQEAGTKKNGPAADAPYVETRDEKALGKAGEDESLDAKAPSTVVAGGEGKARAGLVMDERSAGLREDQRAMLDAVGKQLGNIYNQFKGKVKEAFAFLKKKKMAFLKVYGIGMT